MGHSEVWGPAGDRLMVVALTGGIASGKTEVARALTRLGALVIDADDVAREVTLPGAPAYGPIVEAFGEGILDYSGQIDRTALAAVVFRDNDKRQVLNGITHPSIIGDIIRQVNEYANGLGPEDVPAAVVDAALIVDVGASGLFDLLLVVSADETTRRRRMVEGRGMDRVEAENRIASQIPDEKRRAMADLLIENNGTISELEVRVAEAWDEIARKARGLYS